MAFSNRISPGEIERHLGNGSHDSVSRLGRTVQSDDKDIVRNILRPVTMRARLQQLYYHISLRVHVSFTCPQANL